MKIKICSFMLVLLTVLGLFSGCSTNADAPQIAATTLPVYQFTSELCAGTGLKVNRLVTESVSCLHDYTLQVSQMRTIEAAQTVVISGAGLEDFLSDALLSAQSTIDSSKGIPLLEGHSHAEDHHEQDPHIWLSPENAKIMVQNICTGLTAQFPDHQAAFEANQKELLSKLDALKSYAEENLRDLSCRKLITFHDGFSYLAQSFNLTILKSIEEEAGSEASGRDLIDVIDLVKENHIPAIFTEVNGSNAAAKTIATETGAAVYTLDMAMAGDDYFQSMYQNIDTLKEALG